MNPRQEAIVDEVAEKYGANATEIQIASTMVDAFPALTRGAELLAESEHLEQLVNVELTRLVASVAIESARQGKIFEARS